MVGAVLYVQHQVELAEGRAAVEALVGNHDGQRRIHAACHEAIDVVERYLPHGILATEGPVANHDRLVVVHRAWVVVDLHLGRVVYIFYIYVVDGMLVIPEHGQHGA